MIDELFKRTLPKEYGISRAIINFNLRRKTGIFEEGDPIACNKCKVKSLMPKKCNEMAMKVDAGSYEISIVDYEAYINQFDGRKIAEGKRCDLFLCDEDTLHKIVFCDIGCYAETHFAKKRVEAHNQTTASIKRLLDKPSGLSFINKFEQKHLVFFRRNPAFTINSNSSSRVNVDQNIQIFTTTPASTSTLVESEEIVNGTSVTFVIVNYPNVYYW